MEGEAISVIIESRNWFSAVGGASPFVIAVSAAIAVFTAFKTMKTHRAVARKRATIDVILKLESEPTYQKSLATFKDLRDNNKLLTILDENRSQKDVEAHLDIVTFINHYELICCGMMEDTLDELFYFKWYRGAFLKHWEDLEELVKRIRNIEKNDQTWIRFENFANCWSNDQFVTIKKDKPSNHYHNHSVKNPQD